MDTADVCDPVYDEWIMFKEREYSLLIGGFDDDEQRAVVCVGSAKDNGSVVKELIHKRKIEG